MKEIKINIDIEDNWVVAFTNQLQKCIDEYGIPTFFVDKNGDVENVVFGKSSHVFNRELLEIVQGLSEEELKNLTITTQIRKHEAIIENLKKDLTK